MSITRCRLCGAPFFVTPLLFYRNMPKAAQMLPNEADLDDEVGADLEIVQCSACGLVQLTNDPVPYYREVIRATAVSTEMSSFRRKQFASFIERYGLKGHKILEVGCGRGEYLALMAETGAEVFGLEASVGAVELLRKEIKRENEQDGQAGGGGAECGFLETPETLLAAGPFDAFFMMSFLEHLPDPGGVLTAIARNLSPGGVGLIEVPNFDMILKNELFAEFINDHLFYFMQETFETTLRTHGFEVLDCRSIWHDYILSAEVRKRHPVDVSGFESRRLRLQQLLEDFLNRFSNIALWGAGHQAFALLSLTGIADRIRYVVDSAPFKQGRFTPATHRPILPPETLRTDPVDAVLVVAGSYSEEICQTLRRDFDPNLHLAILRENNVEIVTPKER